MLSSLRVLDLTWVLGGPFAGQVLAELGAEIIKIESPEGDQSRAYPPYYFEGDSSFFLSVNRGKKSVVINLKSGQGREVFYDLVRQCDAVMYGFVPDVPARLGIDFQALKKINPRIVVGQLIGLHDEAPYATQPSFDIIAQALGGIMSITGEANGRPTRVGYQVADLAAGLYLANGILAGVIHALKMGVGKKIQISLLDCQLAMLTWQAQNYFVSGDIPKASGTRHPMLAPSEVFNCADEKYVAISATTEQFWQPFCKAIDAPELASDPRFTSSELRIKNVAALAEELARIFACFTCKDAVARLERARVPVGPVNNVADALAQPLASIRHMVENLSHPMSGVLLKFLGNPFKYDGAEPLDYPPKLGAHTADVLAKLCGYDATTLQNLHAQGAIKLG
ncbi:MAG: CoA transferase [Pseudomonadota bacterium]|nr:CoA transferase [Pseudomonadota bacterium]